jgi:hypothetical protein
LTAAFARASLVHLFDRHGAAISRISRWLDAVAGLALVAIATMELLR